MAEPTIEQIRKCVTTNHGGTSHLDDAGILAIWRNLPPAVQKVYLKQLGEQKAGKE